MKTSLDCMPCFLRQTLEAARSVTENPQVHEQIVREVLKLLATLDFDRSPPVVGQLLHRRLRALTGVADPYREAKTRFNRMAMDALPELEEQVRQARDPLLTAARCAVAANAIDMGVASALTSDDVRRALRDWDSAPPLGDWGAFQEAASRARSILYLADNAGEIAVDRLAIQALGPARVTVAVRGRPVLNDATMIDALQVGLDKLVPVIDNGSDAPGTLLEDCSPTFRQHFDQADLIIAKGQGNYETLAGKARNIAFWFKVKCPLVSERIGLPLGALVLLPPGFVQGGVPEPTILQSASTEQPQAEGSTP